MNKFKILAVVFIVIAFMLSNMMCANIAFEYCNMLWRIKYHGFSAPASIAFFLAIPYVFGILICIVLANVFWKKSKY